MADPFSRDRFRRPERFFEEFLRKGVKGLFREKGDNVPFLYRALVLGVDTEGGKFENPDGEGTVSHNINGKKFDVTARTGPANPPNSIKARVITEGLDKFYHDEDLRVFWPFFPENISVPIKPGEHVYVLFEDERMEHGLWVSKVSGHVGVNYAPGKNFFTDSGEKPLVSLFPETSSATSGEKKFNEDDDAAEILPGDKLSSLF